MADRNRIWSIRDGVLDALPNKSAATGNEVLVALLDTMRIIVAETECAGCRKLMSDTLREGLPIMLADAEAAATAEYGNGSMHTH